jgi:anti-sigma regulatory factor (Ser/Thr protein kinase)
VPFVSTTIHDDRLTQSFRHEALLYSGRDDFRRKTARFIREAVAAQEPILVVVDAEKIELLRAELGFTSDKVLFGNMAELGLNPARIIGLWREFVAEHTAGGRRVRGIGEPISATRSADELIECQRHEALLNLAFADAPAWWLVCPYDTSALDASVIDEANRTHPLISNGTRSKASPSYRDIAEIVRPFDAALREPAETPAELPLQAGRLKELRRLVARRALAFGMSPARTADLVFAVNEIATNSLCHADGNRIFRLWHEGDTLLCEMRDDGRITQPMAGRERPEVRSENGRGLWLANQLCDLVQVRSYATGSVVRIHMSR